MDVRPSVAQADFAASVRRFAQRAYQANDSARHVGGDYGPQVAPAELARLGLTGLTLPESAGGDGAGLLDLCLVLDELGAAGVTTPLIASSVVAGGLLAEAGDRNVLKHLASGSVATTALLAPDSVSEWAWRPAPAGRTAAGWSLSAEYTQVHYAQLADWLLVPVDLEGRGPSLILLHRPLHQHGVAVRPQRVIGGPPRAAVHFTDVPIGAGDVLPIPPDRIAPAVETALLRASVATAAHTVGACQGALDLVVQWAKDRHQFGRPIGSFQSVSARCADIRIVIDPARLLVREAAWALDTEHPGAPEFAAVAKAYLAQACASVSTDAHQVMGAIGYSVEHPLHLHTRTVKAFQNAYGSGTFHLERVAQALGM